MNFLVEAPPLQNICALCGNASTTLKRCTGCTVVLYCSKACQKQDWPEHKSVRLLPTPIASRADNVRPSCRVSPNEEVHKDYIKSGYTAPATVSAKVREWAETHRYALSIITNAAVHLARAPDEKLEDTLASQRAMTFVIVPLGDNPHEDNPSTAFRIVGSGFIGRDDEEFLKDSWEDAQQYHRAEIEEFQRQPEPSPAIAGLVLTCFFVNTIGLTILNDFPIYRVRTEQLFAPPLDVGSRFVLEETSRLCKSLMRTIKLVIREPQERGQLVPDVGTLVQSKKTWKWKKEDLDWRDRLPTHVTGEMRSSYTAHQLFTYFKHLIWM